MIVIAERPRAQRAAEPHRYHGKGLKMGTYPCQKIWLWPLVANGKRTVLKNAHL